MYIRKWDLMDDDPIYTKISNLNFAPQTDIASVQLPINEFSVDIYTNDTFFYCGMTIALYDDLDNLWARYWITAIERPAPGIIRLRAQSTISKLIAPTLPAVMYEQEPIVNVLNSIFIFVSGLDGDPRGQYTITPELEALTISGFCPEQSARDRLLWVCFVAGAFIRTYFSRKVEIIRIDTTQDEIPVPIRSTFWRPEVNSGDWVTGLRLTEYAFELAFEEPESGAKTVTDGMNTWLVTQTEVYLANPDSSVPMNAPENVVEFKDCMLVNSGNSADILSHLAEYYFSPITVTADLINNGEYKPGKKLLICTDADTRTDYSGYVTECNFQFGMQAKATVKLVAAEEVSPRVRERLEG